MVFNIISNIETCYKYTSEAPLTLVYYSHFMNMAIALIFGVYVFLNNKKNLINRVFFTFSIVFSFWLFLDFIQWVSPNGITLMNTWSIYSIFDILFFILVLYFCYLYIDKEDITFAKKIVFVFMLLPLIIFSPTKLNLVKFDATLCVPIENEHTLYFYYSYFLEVVIACWLILLLVLRYRKVDHKLKQQIIYLTFGTSSFLVFTFVAGFVADYIYNHGYTWGYNVQLYGFFGAAIFLGFLAYLIVRYKAFNIKLIATQALVVALIIGIGSQFFFIQNQTNIILNTVTFCLALGFGYFLVRSVKLEVQRKEGLQSLSDQLAVANDKLRQLDKAKSEFISIASHQLRTPLTAIKGFVSLLLEGTYGQLPEAQKSALEKVYISNERLVQLVEDLLNISRIDAGRMEFDFQEAQVEDMVQEVVNTLELSAKAKKLYLEWKKPETPMPKIKIDITKIKEVISNMVDNAIKYTQKGGVKAKVESGNDQSGVNKVLRVIVSDTGMGMDKDELEGIFEKFQRGKQSSHYHTDGTGLGMYVGKKMVAEHKGRIWAESAGKGKGSRFILELPVA
jgi:signal transduction histidine kinase